jgi:hypothetical protein
MRLSSSGIARTALSMVVLSFADYVLDFCSANRRKER